MTENVTRHRSLYEPLVTAFSVAGVFIILGFVIAFTPDISQKTSVFFNDLTTVTYSLGGSNMLNLVAPAHPEEHIAFFRAIMEFFLAVGMLEILVLALRMGIRSPIRRISETIGNLVFWLGGAVVANVYLLAGTLNGWFEFWTGLLLVLGISMIARFTVYLVAKSASR
ncbi:MAG: hypothetical protein ABSA79_08295 [Candidatus Bathyarchaeia archaeon]|jgi:hypothetical protein